MIGFAECVRPGGKPTDAHCLDMYHQPGWATSLIYPITRRELVQGDGEKAYWKEEGRPRLRDMFHDKIFCHRFFESFGAQHPVLVAEVVNHKMTQVFVPPGKAPQELIWKARYSTMGIGVEKFEGFERQGKEDWAP